MIRDGGQPGLLVARLARRWSERGARSSRAYVRGGRAPRSPAARISSVHDACRVGALAPEPQVGAHAVAYALDVARLACSRGDHLVQQFACCRVVGGEKARFLVGELLVEGVARDPCAAGDVADRRRSVALRPGCGDQRRRACARADGSRPARERGWCGPRGSRSVLACAVVDTLVHYPESRDSPVHQCLEWRRREPWRGREPDSMRRPMGTDSAPCAHDGRVGGRRFVRSRFLAVLAVVAAGMCLPASAVASYNVSLTRTTGGVANISGAELCRHRIRDRLRTGAGRNLSARRNVPDGRRRTFCVLRPGRDLQERSRGGCGVHEPQLGHLLDLDQAGPHGPETAEAPLPAGTLDGSAAKWRRATPPAMTPTSSRSAGRAESRTPPAKVRRG